MRKEFRHGCCNFSSPGSQSSEGHLKVRRHFLQCMFTVFDPHNTSKATRRLTSVLITIPGFSRITASVFLARIWGIFCIFSCHGIVCLPQEMLQRLHSKRNSRHGALCAGADYNLTLSHSRLRSPVAKFIVHDWGDKVDSGFLSLSYTGLPGYTGQRADDNPMPESTTVQCRKVRLQVNFFR